MPQHHNTILVLLVELVVDVVYIFMYVIHKQCVHHIHHMLSKIPTTSASQKPNDELAAWNEDEDLSLVTSDLVSVLKGNSAGEVGQFVCYTKAKQSVGQCVGQGFRYICSRPCPEGFRNQENCPMAQFMSFTWIFDSILEKEAWIKIKIDQITAQFVACWLNYESLILLNFFRD